MAIQEILGLAQATRGTFEEAEKLVNELGLTGDEAVKALAQIRQFNSVKLDIAKQFEALNQELGLTEVQFKKLSQVARTVDGEGGLKGLAGNAQDLFGKLGMVSFGFNQIQMAVQTMAAAARPAFDLLIMSNEKLNAQLLSSQANLANATRIFKGGVEVTDPLERINASRPALNAALKQIEKDTVDLVGVTSADVNQLFQITLQNAAALNQQSKEFPKPIEAATSLTKGWAASLKVMNIPLFAANQEINSIVKGQITQDSLMAKNLGINNEMVQRWKSQGTLVDELNKRLQTFVTANGIASRSIEGIGSNIQDTIEIIGREAGQALLEPVIQSMDFVYQGLKNSKEGVLQFFKTLSEGLLESLPGIGNALKPILGALGGLVTALAPGFNAIVQIVLKVSEIVAGVLGPALTLTIAALTPIAQILSGALVILNAIADGFMAVFRAAQPVRDFLSGMFVQFGQNASATINTISSAFGSILNALKPIGEILNALFIVAQKQLTSYFNTIAQVTKPLRDLLGGMFQGASNAAGNFFKFVINGLGALAENIKNSPVGKIIGALLKELEKASGTKIGAPKVEDNASEIQKPNEDIDLRARAIDDLGTSYEQLKKKAAAAQKMIDDEGGGDSALLQQAFKDTIAVTQQQIELGQISAAEAERRLTDVANNKDAEVATQQQAQDTIAKIRKAALDLEKSEIEGQIAQVNEAVASGRVSDVEGARQVTALKRKELENQLEDTRSAILAEQIAISEGRGSTSKLKQLQQQEKQAAAELAKNAKEGRDRESQERLKDFDEAQKVLDGRKAQGLVSEQAYADASLKISQDRLDRELNQIASKRQKLDPNDKEGREALDAQEAEIRKKQVEIVQKYGDQKLALLRDQSKLESANLEARKAQGLVSETQYADELLKLTQSRLTKELALISDARSRTPAGNTEALRKLAIEEAQIRQQQVEAIEKFEAQKIAALDRAQKKALDLVKASQTQAEIETQKLLNSRQIREVEASDRLVKQKRKLLEEELKLEQEKTATIAGLPALSDPQKEEERQAKIRASRQRSGELTLSILQNEREQQESTARVVQDKIDQQLKLTLNSYTEQEQALTRISAAQDFIAKSQERQNQLLAAQKDLQQAIAGYVDGEYRLAESLLTSENKKRKLREEAARSRLEFLDREQAMERQSLDLEIQKNNALLEREKIQNRIAQSKADAGLAKAIADQAKTAADPKATAADKNAAALTVTAAQEEVIGTRFQGRLLEDQGAQQAGLDEAKRRSLSYKQDLQRDQARADIAKETKGKGDDRALADEFTAKARNTRNDEPMVNVPTSTAGKFEDFRRTELAKLQEGIIQQQINQAVLPAIQQPQNNPQQNTTQQGNQGQASSSDSPSGESEYTKLNLSDTPFLLREILMAVMQGDQQQALVSGDMLQQLYLLNGETSRSFDGEGNLLEERVSKNASVAGQPTIAEGVTARVGQGIQPPLPSTVGTPKTQQSDAGLKEAIRGAIAEGFAQIGAFGTINQTNNLTNNLNGVEAAGVKAAETIGQQILNQFYDVARLAKARKATA